MSRAARLWAMCALLLVVGCGDRLVELPTERPVAIPVPLGQGPLRCPVDTVAHPDDSPASGAGAVPADFEGRTVLECRTDYMTATRRGRVDRFTISQWSGPVTPALRTSLDLPDRARRPALACAAGTSGHTAVYLVDSRRRSVRVLLPWEDPCHVIRRDVVVLLPGRDRPAQDTFTASR
ncbi:MAG TPA: hypothetical protein VF642_11505 [Propionibacteriaceae bacterium]